MKKITKVEDGMSGIRNFDKHYSLNGELLKDKLIALSFDDPSEGCFGCVVFEKDNEKHSLYYISHVYDPCEKIRCKNSDEFINFLQESLDHNYPTFVCDIPKQLRIGFVSLRNNGNKHYSLRLAEYKAYLKAQKDKKETSDT